MLGDAIRAAIRSIVLRFFTDSVVTDLDTNGLTTDDEAAVLARLNELLNPTP